MLLDMPLAVLVSLAVPFVQLFVPCVRYQLVSQVLPVVLSAQIHVLLSKPPVLHVALSPVE